MLLFAWLAAPLLALSVRHDVPDSAYVVSDKDYPAVVDLFKNDCLATLISPSWLLTVAHCAADLKAGQALRLGRVDKIVLHPRWQKRRKPFDVALVRLAKPVEGVEPAALYRGRSELGATLTLVGRGLHATGVQGQRGAQADGKLRRCTNVVGAVREHFLELRFERPGEPGVTPLEGVGVSGDSGGPSFIDGRLAGLNSWGKGGHGLRVGQYGARDYETRVSSYLPWIGETIAGR